MYTRICAALSKLSLQFAAVGLVVILFCVLYMVIGRYVFNEMPAWAERLALLLTLYVTLLSTAVSVRDAGHIGLESFLVLAPEWLRLKLEYVIHILLIIFGALMLYFGITLAVAFWGESIPTLEWAPDGLRRLPLALCGGLMILFSIEHIIALVKGIEVEPSWH
ncbi:MAG: C4-dicarboxylate transporter permease [Rhodocyclales bacterium]|nr:C4-dicarboxylate transporter permease [Rhodocyclales bacterium]